MRRWDKYLSFLSSVFPFINVVHIDCFSKYRSYIFLESLSVIFFPLRGEVCKLFRKIFSSMGFPFICVLFYKLK